MIVSGSFCRKNRRAIHSDSRRRDGRKNEVNDKAALVLLRVTDEGRKTGVIGIAFCPRSSKRAGWNPFSQISTTTLAIRSNEDVLLLSRSAANQAIDSFFEEAETAISLLGLLVF